MTSYFASHRLARILAGALALSLSSGCKVIDTVPVVSETGELCRTAFGSYFLPKSMIPVKVTQVDNAPFQIVVSQPVADADRRQMFCLDYLASPLADDTMTVIRDQNLGVLVKVGSDNDDKSKDIALTALEIGLIGATGNPNVTRKASIVTDADTDKTILADFMVDPFDRTRLAEINAVLTGVYGYCVIIEGHTVGNENVQSYCNAPFKYGRYVKVSPDDALPAMRPDEMSRGILYKPNQTHQMVIFRRRDPQSRTPWQIFQTKRVEMPNISPIFSVGVERSAFVFRKTTLLFDKGVLKDITIEKPSEALSFVEIPLRVVQAVTQIPAEIIKVRVAAINNEKEIAVAQAGLIQTQRATAEAVESLRSTGSVAPTDGTRAFLNRDSRLPFAGNSRAGAQALAQCQFDCGHGPNAAVCRAKCPPDAGQ